MWLKLDFGDTQFETALARYISRLLGNHYSRLARATVRTHRCLYNR
jgi:hypothetical protein